MPHGNNQPHFQDKAIAVDWGGIIRSLNDESMFERIRQEIGIPSEFFTPLLSHVMKSYIRGEPETETEFWKLLTSHLGLFYNPSLKGLWKRTFEENYLPNSRENEHVVSLLGRVRNAGYPLILVTNGVLPIHDYMQAHPLVSKYNLFDIHIESARVKCKKPEPAFLDLPQRHLTTHGLEIPRSSIAVIDDIAIYHEAWLTAGYNSVHAPEFEKAGHVLEHHLRQSGFRW